MSSRVKKPQATPAKKTTTVTSQQWSGPLPPPAALASFDAIIPNGADRILRLAEQEQAHRIAMEQTALQANITATKESQSQFSRGQLFGSVTVALSIVATVYTSYIGAHPAVSIALVGVPILGMIRAIIGKQPGLKEK